MKSPIISVSTGKYTKTCFVEITSEKEGIEIFYSTNGDYPSNKYYGPIAVRQTSKIQAIARDGNSDSEISVSEIEIIKSGKPIKGSVAIIGGAEHCSEIHEKLVEKAGGKENVRIAFLPTSSSAPYSAGIDRVVRFRELAGVNIDETLVPELEGKKNFSDLKNESKFWIIPIAIINDENTGKNVSDDDDAPLAQESTFPDLDESLWKHNARDPKIAEKLLDGNYNLIFMTGGNQARYLECLYYEDYTETPVLSAIREILEEKGGVIAGTSAGAAVLSDIMIQGGGSYGATLAGVHHENINLADYDDNYTPFTDKKDGRVWVGKGFGFLPSHVLSGTHFVARGRIGRLLTASMYLKGIVGKPVTGIGVDEDTAVFAYPDDTFEVIGALGALIIDTSISKPLKSGRGLSIHGDQFVLHYLEHGDLFEINKETGEINVLKFNENKKKIEIPKPEKYFIEPDIFGRNSIRDFVQQCLINSEAPCAIGAELVDNTESSYDSILFHDLVKEDTILFRFTRNEKTCSYAGPVSYSWWGKGDRYYPRLQKVTEDRFSFSNIGCRIIRMDVLNFPDMSDSSNIPIKSEYIKDGYTENQWQDLFDDYKNYRLGLLILPLSKTTIELHSFFFDYAYYDYDRNGRYSPPRYNTEGQSGKFQDYDIVQMNTAASTEIFVDDKLVGTTDNHGILTLEISEWSKIKALYHGKRSDYFVETENNSIRTALLVFEELEK